MIYLFIVLLVLKLTGTIKWSWWWITSPLWVPFVLTLGFVWIIILLIIAIASHKF